MSFSCILIAFIICFSNLVFAILPNNLVFTPTAIFSDRLETEIGYQSTFYTVDGTSNHTGFYLNRTLSKHLVYGIEFYDPSGSTNIYHHIAIHLLRLFNNSNYEFHLSTGVNYLTNDTIQSVNQSLYDYYFTTSWNPKNHPVQVHSTIARD